MDTIAVHQSIAPCPHVQPLTEKEIFERRRRLFIGGSDSASMFSQGWGCHRALIYKKRGAEPDFKRTEREERILERGTRLEDTVAHLFAEETGLAIRRNASRIACPSCGAKQYIRK